MADADKPTMAEALALGGLKKKTKAQTAAMKEQMAKMQKLLQAQRQSLEALQKKKGKKGPVSQAPAPAVAPPMPVMGGVLAPIGAPPFGMVPPPLPHTVATDYARSDGAADAAHADALRERAAALRRRAAGVRGRRAGSRTEEAVAVSF